MAPGRQWDELQMIWGAVKEERWENETGWCLCEKLKRETFTHLPIMWHLASFCVAGRWLLWRCDSDWLSQRCWFCQLFNHGVLERYQKQRKVLTSLLYAATRMGGVCIDCSRIRWLWYLSWLFVTEVEPASNQAQFMHCYSSGVINMFIYMQIGIQSVAWEGSRG